MSCERPNSGVSCEVANCHYHDGKNCCTADRINVGPGSRRGRVLPRRCGFGRSRRTPLNLAGGNLRALRISGGLRTRRSFCGRNCRLGFRLRRNCSLSLPRGVGGGPLLLLLLLLQPQLPAGWRICGVVGTRLLICQCLVRTQGLAVPGPLLGLPFAGPGRGVHRYVSRSAAAPRCVCGLWTVCHFLPIRFRLVMLRVLCWLPGIARHARVRLHTARAWRCTGPLRPARGTRPVPRRPPGHGSRWRRWPWPAPPAD